MIAKTTKAAHPANTIKCPKGFVPMRIRLKRAQKLAQKLKQEQQGDA